jgi:hypothetical protein
MPANSSSNAPPSKNNSGVTEQHCAHDEPGLIRMLSNRTTSVGCVTPVGCVCRLRRTFGAEAHQVVAGEGYRDAGSERGAQRT